MTALKKYQRLESSGIWRADPEARLRDVVVSFGDASLVISDQNMAPLAHWSLAAVERVGDRTLPATFTPGSLVSETLEIDDPIMVGAIDKVRAAILRSRPSPGRLRRLSWGAVLAALGALAIFWLPGALERHALTIVPAAKRVQIGAALLSRIERFTGPACTSPLGSPALARLGVRVLGPGKSRLLVVRDGVKEAAHLPGGLIVLNRALVENYEGPQVAAGYILAEYLRARNDDPLARLLNDAGVLATFRLLTTGEIGAAPLAHYARALLSASPARIAPQPLLALFAAARIPSTPYAYAIDITGESTIALIEADPFARRSPPALISDDDWVSLQGICGD